MRPRPDVPAVPNPPRVVETTIRCRWCASPRTRIRQRDGDVLYVECRSCCDDEGRASKFKVYQDRRLEIDLPEGCWSGAEVVLFGGGRSALGFDMDRLIGRRSIAVNDSWRIFADAALFPSLSFSADQHWLKKASRDSEYREATGLRAGLDTGGKVPSCFRRVMGLEQLAPHWATSYAELIYMGNNSGLAALNLADVLGAETVYLIGYDLDGYDGRQQAHTIFLERFRSIADRVRARVVNLNPDSFLDCFEFGVMP